MKSTELKNSLDTLFADNNAGGISAADLRQITDALLVKAGGMGYYFNEVTTHQNLTTGEWNKLLITPDSVQTDTSMFPYYITTDPLQSSNFVLTEIPEGTTLHWRSVVHVTTTANGQVINVRANAFDSLGNPVKSLGLGDYYFKTAGTYEITIHAMTFSRAGMHSMDMELKSDDAATAHFHEAMVRLAG